VRSNDRDEPNRNENEIKNLKPKTEAKIENRKKMNLNTLKKTSDENIYLSMPLERVEQDARHGVSKARRALAERDPAAARILGIGIEPKKMEGKNER